MGKNVALIHGDMSTLKATDTPIHIESSDQLDELVADGAVVLVGCHADRCDPCKTLGPTVKETAEEADAVVTKVNIDELQELVRKQGVCSVPILQFCADGKQAKEVIDVQNKEDPVNITKAVA